MDSRDGSGPAAAPMATYKGLTGILAGLVVAIASLIGVLLNSPFMTMSPNLRWVYFSTIGFLAGIFIFGWGVAKLAGY